MIPSCQALGKAFVKLTNVKILLSFFTVRASAISLEMYVWSLVLRPGRNLACSSGIRLIFSKCSVKPVQHNVLVGLINIGGHRDWTI